jgi:hypothetical protein
MNKRVFLFVGLFVASAMPFSVSSEPGKRIKRDMVQNTAQLKQFLASYVGAVAMGGCVGAATGTLAGYVQKQVVQYLNIESSLIKLALMIGACNLGSEISDNIVAALQNSLDGYQVAYQNDPMVKSSWIAGVLAYLHA